MKQFMADITLPEIITQDFVSLIPLQRLQVGILMKSGRLTNYALSLDRSKLWAVFIGNSEEEVKNIINIFPLRKYMDVRLYELAFHEQPQFHFPIQSLN
jgi:muconolactone delta-isomerase